MRILVCGGRDFTDRTLMWEVLSAYTGASVVIHGAQRGADLMAAEWAKQHGIPDLPFEVTNAEWRKIGPAAGPIRNRRMVIEGHPDLVIAFPGGRGTRNMIATARRHNVRVIIVPSS